MKMKLPSLPSLPKFKLPAKIKWTAKPRPRRLQAAPRRAAPAIEDYDDDEPTTKLSSAFVVVLVLHVVAVGGIYAFNEIKKNRRREEPLASTSTKPAATQKPTPSPEAQPSSGNHMIAASTTAASAADSATASAPAMTPIGGNRVHQVKAGDNLTRIANQHNVSIADLAEINGLKETSTLRPGQTLNLPTKTASPIRTAALTTPRPEASVKKSEPATTAKPAAAGSGVKTYVVKKGDNPVAIARKLNVSYDELLKVNKIDDPKKLKPDQVLKVPGK